MTRATDDKGGRLSAVDRKPVVNCVQNMEIVMKTLMIAASALVLATPVLAQTATTGTTQPGTTSPTNGMPSSGMPATGTNAPVTGAADTGTATTATPADARTVIASEFATYDADGNGSLNTGEFDAWMLALKDKSGAEPMKAADKAQWLKGAFKTADADKNKAVSQNELTTYLTAGA
jgi:hypothetical protein